MYEIGISLFNFSQGIILKISMYICYMTVIDATSDFQVSDNLVQSVEGTDISIISQEIFDQDPMTRIQNLKV